MTMQAMPVSTGATGAAKAPAAGNGSAGAGRTGVAPEAGGFAKLLSAQGGAATVQRRTAESETSASDGAGAGRGRGGRREDEVKKATGREGSAAAGLPGPTALPQLAMAVPEVGGEAGLAVGGGSGLGVAGSWAGLAGGSVAGSPTAAGAGATGVETAADVSGMDAEATDGLVPDGGDRTFAGQLSRLAPGGTEDRSTTAALDLGEVANKAEQGQNAGIRAAAGSERAASLGDTSPAARVHGMAGLSPAAVPGEVAGEQVAELAVALAGSRSAGASEPAADGDGAAGFAATSAKKPSGRIAEHAGDHLVPLTVPTGAVPTQVAAGAERGDAGAAGGHAHDPAAVAGKGKPSSAGRTDRSDAGQDADDASAGASAAPAVTAFSGDGAVPMTAIALQAAMTLQAAAPVPASVVAVGRAAVAHDAGGGLGPSSDAAATTAAQRVNAGTGGADSNGAGLSDVAASRLLHTAAGTELRVGARLGELGSVQIRTVFGREQTEAHIAVENEHLRSALTAHLGGLEETLGERSGQAVRATVSVGMGMDAGRDGGRQRGDEQASAGAMNTAGGGAGRGGAGGAGGGATGGGRVRSVGRVASEMAAGRYGAGAGGGGGGYADGGRLDVRV